MDGRSDPLITTLIYQLKQQVDPRQITWPAVYKARPLIQARIGVDMVSGVKNTVGD